LDDYLTFLPKMPERWGDRINGAFMQLQIPAPGVGPNAGATVTLGIEKAQAEGQTIILDFDVFINESFPTDVAVISHALKNLRLEKNALFEAAITDKARRLFQ
jgi:uncharacterized protein (TIGR04255 family)